MALDWFTFEVHIDHTRPRSSVKNCTSAEKCLLDRPPKCLPVRCPTTQYDALLQTSCPVSKWGKTSVSSPLCFSPLFLPFLLAQREVSDSRLTLNYFWLLQNCTKVSGDIPVDPSGGIEYFVYGVHNLTMLCPNTQTVQGHCDTSQVRSVFPQPSAASCPPSPHPPLSPVSCFS